jgi:hypothetical protein
MKFRDRIRRIEEKLFPAIKQDGKQRVPPILEAVYIGVVVVPVIGARRASLREESQHAKVNGQTADRAPGESVELFEKRVRGLLPPPDPVFAREIRF